MVSDRTVQVKQRFARRRTAKGGATLPGGPLAACHEMSCFVMRAGKRPCDMSWDVMFCMRMAHILQLFETWGPLLFLPFPQAGGESSSVLSASSKPYPSASCMSFLRPVSFFPPPGLPEQRDPDSRVSCVRLCLRGRVSAPARFARLIARARGRCRTHFACRLNRRRSACAPAREEKRPRECRSHAQVRYYHRLCRNQSSF